MTRCEQYEVYLAALADEQSDAVPPEIRQPLLDHIAACPVCQAEIAQQRQLSQLLASEAPPPVAAGHWQQAWDAIDEQTTSRLRLRRVLPGWSRWVAIAGSVAAAAIILMAVLLPSALGPGGASDQQFAFASGQDSDIQVIETDAQDETPVVITSGQEDVVVVWVVQDPEDKRST